MSYTVGDGSVVLALAVGVVGYLYVKHQSQQKKIEIIHQERMAAMEKGIPLPEFPLENESRDLTSPIRTTSSRSWGRCFSLFPLEP